MKKKLNHLELFAGVGGFRKAIELFCKANNLNSSCSGYSEIDKYALTSYKSNFNTTNETEIGDILEFTQNKNNITKLKDFDILTAGFPCQPFSIMGKQKGFNDNRGNVFYAICDIINIKNPPFVLLENVKNLKNHDKGNTFKQIFNLLENNLGYNVFFDIFNTADFGLPQNRRRVFILGVRKDFNKDFFSFEFNSQLIKEHFHKKRYKVLNYYSDVLDGVLSDKVDEKYFLSEKIKPTILSNGTKNFRSKSEINQLIARPLTATMVKMHRACQDNYYSEDFIKSKNFCEIPSKIRKITPYEAFKLQGFDEKFVDNSMKSSVSDHQLFKQAGNAVSVNTVFSIISYLYDKEVLKV